MEEGNPLGRDDPFCQNPLKRKAIYTIGGNFPNKHRATSSVHMCTRQSLS